MSPPGSGSTTKPDLGANQEGARQDEFLSVWTRDAWRPTSATEQLPPRLLLDYPETERTLNVGRTTVYKLVGDGELVAVKIGRRSLITAESVRAYVDRLSGGRDDYPEPAA